MEESESTFVVEVASFTDLRGTYTLTKEIREKYGTRIESKDEKSEKRFEGVTKRGDHRRIGISLPFLQQACEAYLMMPRSLEAMKSAR